MSEIARIADLLEQTFEGRPYYGRSVLGALDQVHGKDRAGAPPCRFPYDLGTGRPSHRGTPLRLERDRRNGGEWIESVTTWAVVEARSEDDWQQAIDALTSANRSLVAAVRQLDDAILDQNPIRVPGPYYVMLHGTLQHNVYHAGQIALLRPHHSIGRHV